MTCAAEPRRHPSCGPRRLDKRSLPSAMPVGIEDGWDLPKLRRDEIQCRLGKTCYGHLHVERAGRAPFGEHLARGDVQILEALENPGKDAGVGLSRDAEVKELPFGGEHEFDS